MKNKLGKIIIMEKKLRLQIVKLLIFIIVCILLFFFIENFSNSGLRENRWHLFEQLPEDTIDIVFIGNSHNLTAINPQVIDDLLGSNSYTLGTPSSTIPVIYAEIIKLLETQSPKYIILETFAFDLYEMDPYDYFLRSTSFSFNDIKTLAIFGNPENFYSVFSFPTYHAVLWKTPYSFFKEIRMQLEPWDEEYQNDYKKLFDQKGYVDKKIVISKNDYFNFQNQGIQIIPNLKNMKSEFYFEKIYQLCNDNNIKLILFTTPIISINQKLVENYFPIDEKIMIDEKKLPYLNLDDEFEFSQIHFLDSTHLNSAGAIVASIMMSSFLSNQSNFTLNTEELSYYRNYEFEDFESGIENQILYLNLLSDSKIKNTKFLWNIKTLSEKFSNRNNKQEINMPNAQLNEIYQIQVDIQNKDIEFPLILVFNQTFP